MRREEPVIFMLKHPKVTVLLREGTSTMRQVWREASVVFQDGANGGTVRVEGRRLGGTVFEGVVLYPRERVLAVEYPAGQAVEPEVGERVTLEPGGQ